MEARVKTSLITELIINYSPPSRLAGRLVTMYAHSTRVYKQKARQAGLHSKQFAWGEAILENVPHAHEPMGDNLFILCHLFTFSFSFASSVNHEIKRRQ